MVKKGEAAYDLSHSDSVRRTYQAETLFQLSQQLHSIDSVGRLNNFIVEVLSEMFATMYVVLLERKDDSFVYRSSKGIAEGLQKGVFKAGEKVLLKLKDCGSIAMISEIKEEPCLKFVEEIKTHFGFETVAAITICTDRDIRYLIFIGQSMTLHTIDKDDVKSMILFVNNTQSVLQNLEMMQTLCEEKETLEATIDNMSDGLIHTDTELNILIINSKARKMLEPVVGSLDAGGNILKALGAFKSNLSLEEMLITQEDMQFELSLESEGICYSVFSRKIKNPSGMITGMILILSDTAEEHYADNIKTVFLSTISHKLRTPLTVIREGISLLEEGILGELNVKQKSVAEKTFSQSQYLSSLINSLLDFTKTQADMMATGLRKERHTLNRFFSDLLGVFEKQLKEKKIDVSLDMPAEQVSIYFDKDMLQKAIGNILENAVKFNPEETGVSIEVRQDRDSVNIAIADNGVGIPRALTEHIFEVFTQVDKDMTGQVKGMGLGLYLAKEIIKAHNGSIECRSELGKGTKFMIRLPIV
ncbi:MAG: hypothetical protein HQ558_04740 [Candidatus Omnitrophica bacterium]|nr:hypothetical protein [Candidatus Omnitrophota bacterium]